MCGRERIIVTALINLFCATGARRGAILPGVKLNSIRRSRYDENHMLEDGVTEYKNDSHHTDGLAEKSPCLPARGMHTYPTKVKKRKDAVTGLRYRVRLLLQISYAYLLERTSGSLSPLLMASRSLSFR
jgi:hypothetical protein